MMKESVFGLDLNIITNTYMKRIILLFMISMFGVSLVSAQNIKRWTVDVSFLTGSVYHDALYPNTKGSALVPSVFYSIGSNRSVGLSLLLPLANEDTEYSHSYTTGAELSFKQDFEIPPKFKVSLSALGMFGVTGPYKGVKDHVVGGTSIEFYTTRWLVGIRPNISYQITPKWSANLSYGFLGYMSDNDISNNYVKNSGKWGFNDEMGWGNSLRVGFSYSF